MGLLLNDEVKDPTLREMFLISLGEEGVDVAWTSSCFQQLLLAPIIRDKKGIQTLWGQGGSMSGAAVVVGVRRWGGHGGGRSKNLHHSPSLINLYSSFSHDFLFFIPPLRPFAFFFSTKTATLSHFTTSSTMKPASFGTPPMRSFGSSQAGSLARMDPAAKPHSNDFPVEEISSTKQESPFGPARSSEDLAEEKELEQQMQPSSGKSPLSDSSKPVNLEIGGCCGIRLREPRPSTVERAEFLPSTDSESGEEDQPHQLTGA